MPIVLQPIDQAAKVQLAQQLACWAKMDSGMTDPAVQYGTCCVSPTGQTLGRWTIPDGLCTEYGPLPFTGNGGQAIVCPPTQAEIMPYYIYDSDVAPIDPNTCVLIPEPLPTVTDLAASNITATGMDLTWTAVDGADGYTIQYSPDGGETWTTVTAAASPQALSGLTGGTTYTIRIRATDSTGAALPSAWSTITATTLATPLATPTGVVGTSPAAGELSVTWNNVAEADQYVMEYSSDGGTTWNPAPAVGSSPATVTGLTAGTYSIRVKAQDTGGVYADSEYGTGADVTVA